MSNFLEYSNETHSNIIPQEELEWLAKEVFGVIASNLSRSLGPLGSSATIFDGMQTDATKDGYTIFKNYRFHNRYKRMIYNLIKEPCQKMNNVVGDGTTTAIALTNAIFQNYEKRKDQLYELYRLPRQFTQAWDEVIEQLKSRIPDKATRIDPENYDTIYNIAYVSSNGNAEISRTIAETYRTAKSPTIRQKDSPTNKSYISKINGFDFPANLISDIFVKNQDLTAEEKNIRVMIIDHKVEMDTFNSVIRPINEVLRARGEKLLILAAYYDAYLCDTVLEQYVTMEFRTNGINLIMAQYPLGKLDPHQLADLAVVLRAKVINQDLMAGLSAKILNDGPDTVVESILENEQYEFYRCIGISEEALLSCNTGSLFKVSDITSDKKYADTLARAKKDLEDIISQTDNEKQAYAAKINDANTRVMQLEMNNFIYYIGADSGLQKRIIWDAVEDVIKCVRSAVRYGVVPGCQLSILSACIDYADEINDAAKNNPGKQVDETEILKFAIVDIIYAAVREVYQLVLNGPDRMGIIKTLPRWKTTTENGVDDLIKEAREKCAEIIDKSIERNEVFDMESLDYNPNIITSAETDSMVLTASSELIKILISGNQCIFLDPDVDSSHQEEVKTYV